MTSNDAVPRQAFWQAGYGGHDRRRDQRDEAQFADEDFQQPFCRVFTVARKTVQG